LRKKGRPHDVLKGGLRHLRKDEKEGKKGGKRGIIYFHPRVQESEARFFLGVTPTGGGFNRTSAEKAGKGVCAGGPSCVVIA